MTWARPTLAPSIWRSPASPRRWWQTSQMLAMPVAAIGWPFDCRPPDTLTGVVAVTPRRARLEEVDGAALGAQHQVVVVHELGRGEAVVELDEVEVLGTDAGLLVRLLGGVAGERVDVRAAPGSLLATGRVVSTDADTLMARRCCSRDSVFSFASLTPRRPRPRRRSWPSTSAACSGRRSSCRS